MRLFPTSVGVIHFIGIGGIGMSGIAEILNNLGYSISGSDIKQSTITKRLERLGIEVKYEHDASNVHGASVVVISSSIDQSNPELVEARRLKIPVIKRAEMLGELMKLKKAVAVAGTHGKTTTTSLVAHLLDNADMFPTVVNGGIINSYGSNARLGSGDWIVVEADESDGSFNKLFPTIAVVTNIDADHTENFKDFDDLRDRFLQFVEKIPFYGVGVLCTDHPEVEKIINCITDKRILTYGFNKNADVSCENLKLENGYATFDVNFSAKCIEKYEIQNPENWKNFKLQMVGKHNVQNALSVIAVAIELKIDLESVKKTFLTFQGVNRRFTHIGTINGANIIDDYGHHPVEIEAVLNAAKTICQGKIFAIIQPHRYTRLKTHLHDFAKATMLADHVYIMPVYSAGEKFDGVDHTSLTTEAKNLGHKSVCQLDNFFDIRQILSQKLTNNDIAIFLGAGDISSLARTLMEDI